MKWFEKHYSRLLIDNHITEHDPQFMSKFDPMEYADMVELSGVEVAMVYACCHNGNCYYPTNVGHMHANLKGRDIFGETVSELIKRDIVPLAYYTVIFHNTSAKAHPDWRREDFVGTQHDGRYWFSCPCNSEYREFAKREIAEIIQYPVEGIFIDMTFWPGVCVCHSCRRRLLEETGKEIPHVVDWSDPDWIAFQRARERWMGQFAQELTDSVACLKPHISVTHQFSPVLLGWGLGQSPAIADACDYTSGDFYGGKLQQSLGTKVLSAFSKNVPFEFMTSRCIDLRDHTSMKSEEEMVCETATTLANGGAYFFIDAINPDGSLNVDVYSRISRVNKKMEPFKKKITELKPSLLADIGLYFSMASNVDPRENGTDLQSRETNLSNMTAGTTLPTLSELLGTSVILRKANIPYRIITSDTMDYSGLKTIIINDCAYLSMDECDRLREFVRGGGNLIATAATSLCDIQGLTTGDFSLADVFGVSYSGKLSASVNYLTFNGELDSIPKSNDHSNERVQYVANYIPVPLVQATSALSVAKVSEPLFTPNDPNIYASIHSNPPGKLTEYDGLTINSFGKGQCIYIYSGLLSRQDHAHQIFGEKLIRKYAVQNEMVSVEAPSCVEVTLLQGEDKDTILICLLNYQNEMPNIPVDRVDICFCIPEGKTVKSCITVSNGNPANAEVSEGKLKIQTPINDTIEILEIRMKK